MNCTSEAPLVVKNVAAVPSGPTKVKGPDAELLAAIWKLTDVETGVVALQVRVVHVMAPPGTTAPLSFTDETSEPDVW